MTIWQQKENSYIYELWDSAKNGTYKQNMMNASGTNINKIEVMTHEHIIHNVQRLQYAYFLLCFFIHFL